MVGSWRVGGIVGSMLRRREPRSAAVPFQHEVLRLARAAEDERHGLVAILRDFAGNFARYLVPWSDVPKMVRLGPGDAALHDAVEEAQAVTPAAMMAVVQKVALSGALGPAAKAGARAAEQAEGKRERDLHAVLIFHALRASRADLGGLLAATARGAPAAGLDATLRRDAQAAVRTAAAALGLRRSEIYDRTAALTHGVLPVGFAAAEGPIARGWLRTLQHEVTGLHRHMRDRLAEVPTDLATDLRVAAEISQMTLAATAPMFGAVDRAVLDIGATMRNWDKAQPTLAGTVDTLSSVLDEWAGLIPEARATLRAPIGEMGPRLRRLRALLPPGAIAAGASGLGAAPAKALVGALAGGAPGGAADGAGRRRDDALGATVAEQLGTIWRALDGG